MSKKTIFIVFAIMIVTLLSFVKLSSALVILDINSETLSPNQIGKTTIEVKNDDKLIKDVSASLDLSNLPVSFVGSSEDSVLEIDEGDKETFSFTLKASANAKTGDYNIPYTISYKNMTSPKKGFFSVKISASPDLDVNAILDNPVLGEKSKLSVKIINKGFGDAKFVNFKIIPDNFNLLSEDSVYIGTVSSDDFETANFDLILSSNKPILNGLLKYQDSEGHQSEKVIALSLNTYTPEKAIELGIKNKNNLPIYFGVLILIILAWIIVRGIRKRSRMKKTMHSVNGAK